MKSRTAYSTLALLTLTALVAAFVWFLMQPLHTGAAP